MKPLASLFLPLLLLLAACGGGGGTGSTTSTSSSGSTGSTLGTNGTGGPLLITTTSLPTGLTGKPYTASITSSGGTGKLIFEISGSFFPGGLRLDLNTGAISGTVTGAVFGDVTFKVTDSATPPQTALKTIRMTFNWALDATVGGSIPAAHLNVPFALPYYAGGSNGTVSWSVSAGQLPPGLTISNPNSTEADLVGTPTAAGTYNYALQVVDSSSPPQTATVSSTIKVDSNLAIATLSIPAPYANEAYVQTITAVNGTPPYHWSSQFPSWSSLTIDASTGTISGTISQCNCWATVTVTDSATPAQSATQTYTFLVLPRLAFTGSSALGDAHLGAFYYGNISSVGGQGNLAWSVIAGTLPPGLTIDKRYGQVTGYPSQEGSYNFTIQLQDSSTPPQVAQGQFSLSVKPQVLTLQPSLPARIPINIPFEGAVVASGGEPPITWRIVNGSLPDGLSLDSSTGKVSGTPTNSRQYSVYIQASDSSNPQQNSYNTYGITVGPALGRNDSIATATPIANGTYTASISPLLDPPTGTTLSPDNDYYRITGAPGAIITLYVTATTDAMDPVLELVDANGVRLNSCRYEADATTNFASSCLNDDADDSTLNSRLDYRVPSTATSNTDVFAHVLDWRGDARPDMGYYIEVSGAFLPMVFQTTILPDVAANHGYNQYIGAQGGSGGITGAVTAGQLPPGLSLGTQYSSFNANTGVTWLSSITGNPTTAGTYSFTVTLTDQATPPQIVSQQFSIHVFPQIQLVHMPDQTLQVGQTTTYQATATGGVPPLHFSRTGWTGVTIDSNTGLLTFQPTVAGNFTFMVWVQGSGADSGTEWSNQTINVTVNP